MGAGNERAAQVAPVTLNATAAPAARAREASRGTVVAIQKSRKGVVVVSTVHIHFGGFATSLLQHML